MKELKSILEADRDYTLIIKGKNMNELIGDIISGELATGMEFKVVEVGELSKEEKEHLFRLLPKRSFKEWLKDNTEYYIERTYKTITDTVVRFAIDSGIKDIEKKKVEDRSIQGAKNIYEMCKPLIEHHLELRFDRDMKDGNIIAVRKEDDIEFVSLEEGVTILTPKTAMFWDKETGYSLFEFIIEAIAMNKGYIKYQKHGINVISVSDENYYKELVSNGHRLIIDLWGGWCEPCRLFEKLITPYLKEHQDITLVKISTDFNGWTKKILKKYGSRGIPLIIMMDEGYDIPIKGYYDEMIQKDIHPFFSSHSVAK